MIDKYTYSKYFGHYNTINISIIGANADNIPKISEFLSTKVGTLQEIITNIFILYGVNTEYTHYYNFTKIIYSYFAHTFSVLIYAHQYKILIYLDNELNLRDLYIEGSSNPQISIGTNESLYKKTIETIIRTIKSKKINKRRIT